ncbi:hypothetical protein [Microbacterium sp. CFBP9034]|uniref:hypothetical protein n=1 Tax=Microbacterium sp. CFBP9034 TaxID=3096540 RepID=UPI002A6A8217|nr:hypothetical protein [Microbacterium sp. CFBP9034]MDY0908808.1 hypothetical protein [Microbacterium sp. CFBP9034]
MLVAALAVGTAGCAASSASGSRHAMYDSLDSLARDSSVIVVGSVTGQREESSAGFTSTISTVDVTNTPTNPSLGSNTEPTPVAVGDVIQVRQDGAEPSVLHAGQEYLLYLTPSMLPGDEAAHFFITGAVAGAYVRDGDQFTRVAIESGDDLPDTIDVAGAEG